MVTFKFSMSMLKREFKKSIFYWLTMVFATAMCFVFFHIINNEYLVSHVPVQGGGSWSQVVVPFSTIVSFLIILFCCFMIFFANDFFVSKKTKEIAIITLSGCNAIRSTMYLIYQTTALAILASPLGVGLGYLLAPCVNSYMYEYLGVTSSIYYVPVAAISQTLILVVMVVIMLCVFASGYIYRNDIKFLMSEDSKMEGSDTRKLKIPNAVYIFIYFFGIVMMFMDEHSNTMYTVPSLVGIAGSIGIIKYVMPDTLSKIKQKYLLTKRYALLYVSNLNYSIRRAVILIVIMSVSITGMVTILASQQNAPREYATSFIGYIVIVVLLVTSILYKFCMEAQSRKMLFFNMWKIGYTKMELKKIIRNEVFYFYLVLLMVPMLYVLFIAGSFVYHGEMSLLFACILVLIYTVPIMISGFISYGFYKKMVLSPIQGGNK